MNLSDQTKALQLSLDTAAQNKAQCSRTLTADQAALADLQAKLTAAQTVLTADKTTYATVEKAALDAFVAYCASLAADIGVKLPVTIPGTKA